MGFGSIVGFDYDTSPPVFYLFSMGTIHIRTKYLVYAQGDTLVLSPSWVLMSIVGSLDRARRQTMATHISQLTTVTHTTYLRDYPCNIPFQVSAPGIDVRTRRLLLLLLLLLPL